MQLEGSHVFGRPPRKHSKPPNVIGVSVNGRLRHVPQLHVFSHAPCECCRTLLPGRHRICFLVEKQRCFNQYDSPAPPARPNRANDRRSNVLFITTLQQRGRPQEHIPPGRPGNIIPPGHRGRDTNPRQPGNTLKPAHKTPKYSTHKAVKFNDLHHRMRTIDAQL